jgi:hypothetical protein
MRPNRSPDLWRPSRLRATSQFASWVVRGRWSLISTYLRLRRSDEFDRMEYVSAYPDVGRARLDPLMHYVEHGRPEGRQPSLLQYWESPAAGTPRPRRSGHPDGAQTGSLDPPWLAEDGGGESNEWSAVPGESPNEFYGRLSRSQQGDVRSTFTPVEATFLYSEALNSSASTAVELVEQRTLSTLILCQALKTAARTQARCEQFRLVSYLVTEPPAQDRQIVPDELSLPRSLRQHVSVKQARMVEVMRDFAPAEVDFLFLDVLEPHPRPTLALLSTVRILAPHSKVVLRTKSCGTDEIRALLDGLDVGNKCLIQGGAMGSFSVPATREELRKQLTALLFARPWRQALPDPEYWRQVIRASES